MHIIPKLKTKCFRLFPQKKISHPFFIQFDTNKQLKFIHWFDGYYSSCVLNNSLRTVSILMPLQVDKNKNPFSLCAEEVCLFCGVRGIRTPGTNCSVRQFSKLVVSATHPSHRKFCFEQVDKFNIKISF